MAVRNAGIVGGRRAVFERALSTVVDRMRGLTEIGDMVCSPHVSKPAAICLQACSPIPPSPQPHTSKPAARCAPARSPCFQACSYVPGPATPRAQVAWNEVALTQGNLITGYPHGPTNLPMYGKLSREHNCGKLCRHQWLNATRGMYWCGPCSAAPSAPVPHAHTPPAKTQSVSDRVGSAQVWSQAAGLLAQICGQPLLRVPICVRPAGHLFSPRDN